MMGARRAFTLIEMLIVIGIIMIFLALSIGAVMRTPAVNKLIGTEQLMSDVIRQSRDTARSTGSPVQVVISRANRTVSGVSQVPVWNETFEVAPPGVTPVSPWAMTSDISNNFITALGQSGQGLIGATAMGTTPPATYPLTPTQSLSRNTTAIDGFYLACAILPPDPQAPYYTYADGTPTPDIIPLVQVGDENDSNAVCGLALVLKNTNIQKINTIGSPSVEIDADALSWDLVGWLNDSGGFHMVSSIENSIANSLDPSYLPAGGLDVTGPIVGNRWEDVGLLYDGHTLELYRNGQKIAQLLNNDTGGAYTSQPKNASYCGGTVYVGRGNFDQLYNKGLLPNPVMADPNPPYPNPGGSTNPVIPPTQQRYLVGTLDNARLLRLGTDRTANLPGGVIPDGDYAFTVRPDGVVETTVAQGGLVNSTRTVTSVSDTGTISNSTVNVTTLGATITFQLMGEVAAGAAGQNLDTAVITIDPDGTVDMNTNPTTNQVNTGVRTGGVSP